MRNIACTTRMLMQIRVRKQRVRGIEMMPAWDMGEGLKLKVEKQGIICGCTEKVGAVTNDYIAATIKDSGNTCSGKYVYAHHGHRHGCNGD